VKLVWAFIPFVEVWGGRVFSRRLILSSMGGVVGCDCCCGCVFCVLGSGGMLDGPPSRVHF